MFTFWGAIMIGAGLMLFILGIILGAILCLETEENL
jgi:hypothetical protein